MAEDLDIKDAIARAEAERDDLPDPKDLIRSEWVQVYNLLGAVQSQVKFALERIISGRFNSLNGYQKSSIISTLAGDAGDLEKVRVLLQANRPSSMEEL